MTATLLPRYRDPVICTYDLTKFDAEVVINVLRTHPTVLIGEVLAENPFFSPPDEFLAELRGGSGPLNMMPRAALGRVFEAWSDAAHLVDRIQASSGRSTRAVACFPSSPRGRLAEAS